MSKSQQNYLDQVAQRLHLTADAQSGILFGMQGGLHMMLMRSTSNQNFVSLVFSLTHSGQEPDAAEIKAFVKSNKLIVNYTQIFAPALHDLYATQKILDDKESRRQELNQQVQLLAKKLHNLSRLREKNCITAAQYWERRNPLERELTDVKNTISKAATNHPLLRTLAQTKQLAEHYTYLKPLAEFDEHEFKFAVNRVLVDSESCTFELKNGMKFKEIF